MNEKLFENSWENIVFNNENVNFDIDSVFELLKKHLVRINNQNTILKLNNIIIKNKSHSKIITYKSCGMVPVIIFFNKDGNVSSINDCLIYIIYKTELYEITKSDDFDTLRRYFGGLREACEGLGVSCLGYPIHIKRNDSKEYFRILIDTDKIKTECFEITKNIAVCRYDKNKKGFIETECSDLNGKGYRKYDFINVSKYKFCNII